MRRVIGQSNGSASSPLSRFSADFIMNIAGSSSPQGQAESGVVSSLSSAFGQSLPKRV
jgi:hypothetical protein